MADEEVERYPAPLVAWKAHATLGRLYSRMVKSIVAEQACMAAATVARQIAEHASDHHLRQRFENLVSRSLGMRLA